MSGLVLHYFFKDEFLDIRPNCLVWFIVFDLNLIIGNTVIFVEFKFESQAKQQYYSSVFPH